MTRKRGLAPGDQRRAGLAPVAGTREGPAPAHGKSALGRGRRAAGGGRDPGGEDPERHGTGRPRQKQRLGQRAGPAERRHAAPPQQSAGRQSPDRHPFQSQRPVQKKSKDCPRKRRCLPRRPTKTWRRPSSAWKSRQRIEAAISGIKDETLRDRIRRAMLRAAHAEQWKRDQGWQPCTRCGALAFPSAMSQGPFLCPLCRAGAT